MWVRRCACNSLKPFFLPREKGGKELERREREEVEETGRERERREGQGCGRAREQGR